LLRKIILIAMLFAMILVVSGRRDPGTGRVRILYLGDAWGPTPYIHLEAEPSFMGTPIPATFAHLGTYSDGELRRFMRIYMPRSYHEFVSGYDTLILADTNRALYSSGQLEWFKRGVVDEGIGIMMVGGIEGFGGVNNPSWSGTPVEDVLPVICLDDQHITRMDFRVAVNLPEEPFTESLPWETMPFFHGMNIVTTRDGSKTFLTADRDPPDPVLVYWEYGEGRGLAHMPCWHPAWGYSIMYHWDYYPDYVVNMVYLIAGVQIPRDPELMHLVRTGLGNYVLNRAVAMGLMDFVEKFGADISVGEEHLFEIGEAYTEARRLFIDQDYDQTLVALDELEDEFRLLSNELVDLKNQALLWIYIIELLSISGTAIVAGFILWSLMVRRRLYREVRITRAQI
jgi:hypothetical protein